MTGKRAETLLEMMGQIEYFTLGRAWAALTDDEFFWEPFTTTWSVRRRGECRTSDPFGVGEWVADFEIPEPAPVPMTTIAWLYWHIGSMPGRLCDIDFLGGTRTMASGWTSPYLTHHPIFTGAAEAVGALRDGWQRLRGAIERADDDQLEVTTAGYTYAAEPPEAACAWSACRAPRTRPRTSSPARSTRWVTTVPRSALCAMSTRGGDRPPPARRLDKVTDMIARRGAEQSAEVCGCAAPGRRGAVSRPTPRRSPP